MDRPVKVLTNPYLGRVGRSKIAGEAPADKYMAEAGGIYCCAAGDVPGNYNFVVAGNLDLRC